MYTELQSVAPMRLLDYRPAIAILLLGTFMPLLAQGPEVPQWVVKVDGSGSTRYSEVTSQRATIWAFNGLRRLPVTEQKDNGKPRALAGMNYMDGADVVIELGLWESGRDLTKPSTVDPEPVGRYSLKPYESIVIEDLKRFGYEPVKVQVLPNRVPLPEGFHVVNKTTSLKVISVVRTRGDLLVDLENASGQGIAVLAWGDIVTSEGPGGPVIGVSATKRFSMATPPAEDQAWTHMDVAIRGLALADGTIEGEIAAVAPAEAERRGQHDQERKMIGFLDQAVLGTDWRGSEELEKLCAKLEATATDDETALFRVWVEQYPDLAADLRNSYRRGRSFGRALVLQAVRQYDTHDATKLTFAEWWPRFRDEDFKMVLRTEAAPAARHK